MGFLTVEDANTVNLNHINELYELNTANISTGEFENVLYDFVVCSHSINGSDHTFTFKIQNSLWHGGYSIHKSITSESFDDTTNTLTVVTSRDSIKLVLRLCNYEDFNLGHSSGEISSPKTPVGTILKNQLNKNYKFYYTNYVPSRDIYITGGTTSDDDPLPRHHKNIIEEAGLYTFVDPDYGEPIATVLIAIAKTDLVFDLNSTLTVGKLNHIRLKVNSHYLPSGDLVDGAELDIVVNYNGTLITAEYDSSINDYCFDLDLRDKINDTPVNLTVLVNESEYVSPSVHNVVLGCTYQSASSFNELTSSIISGAETIKLTSDIVFTGNLDLTHPLHLICEGNTVNLSSYSISVKETSFTVDNGNFINGTPAIIQDADSKVICNNCSFTNASITDEYKGSVISTLPCENITTLLKGCSILNCHHSIYHQGTLTVINMDATYNDFNDSIDTDYSAFLTMYQGTCDITQSSFNIYYPDLCTDEIDVKFSESLLGLGENVLFNNSLASNLNKHDSLPFFLNYNNQSSIYCRYYYTELEECLVTQAVTGSENKAVCHTILGNPTIYKNNVTVTRATEED